MVEDKVQEPEVIMTKTTTTNIMNKANKAIDAKAKAAGLNWMQRRKLKKGIKGFAYDVGVETASRLTVDAVETTAYFAGRGVVKAGQLAGNAMVGGAKAVKAGAVAATSKVKGAVKGKGKKVKMNTSQQPA